MLKGKRPSARIVEDHRVVIDLGVEVTKKEYLQLLEKAGKPISVSRLSQLMAQGKIQMRIYPSLDNLEMIVLPSELRLLNEARFEVPEPLHTYSGQELGEYLTKFLLDAQGKVISLESALRKVNQTLDEVNAERVLLDEALEAEQLKNRELAIKLSDAQRAEADTLDEFLRYKQQSQDRIDQLISDHQTALVLRDEEKKVLREANAMLESRIDEMRNTLKLVLAPAPTETSAPDQVPAGRQKRVRITKGKGTGNAPDLNQ